MRASGFAPAVVVFLESTRRLRAWLSLQSASTAQTVAGGRSRVECSAARASDSHLKRETQCTLTRGATMKRSSLAGAVILMGLLMTGTLATAGTTTTGTTSPFVLVCGTNGQDVISKYLSNPKQGLSLNVRGTCYETNLMITTPFVTLDGADLRDDGRGVASIISTGTNVAALGIRGAAGVMIRNLTVTVSPNAPDDDAISVYESASARIEHVTTAGGSVGIAVSRNAYGRIIGCTITSNNVGINVYEGDVARIGFTSGASGVAGNTISGNPGTGILVQKGSEAFIVGNSIQNNGMPTAPANGITVMNGSTIHAASNTIDGNSAVGISVFQGSGAQLGGSGTSVFDQPNTGTNGRVGVYCAIGGWVAGRVGGLTGTDGATSIDLGCVTNLLPPPPAP